MGPKIFNTKLNSVFVFFSFLVLIQTVQKNSNKNIDNEKEIKKTQEVNLMQTFLKDKIKQVSIPERVPINISDIGQNSTNNTFGFEIFSPHYDDKDLKFFYHTGPRCSISNCPKPNTCSDEYTCRCAVGFADFRQSENKPELSCQYAQKKQLKAFFLEFFLAHGIGHMYAGRIGYGIFKFFFFFVPFILSVFLCCCGFSVKLNIDSGGCVGMTIIIILCSFCCIATLWQMVDLVLFGMNRYKDANGVPLIHW
jgi:hypothetical protein